MRNSQDTVCRACFMALVLVTIAGCATPATSSFSPSTAEVKRLDATTPPTRTTVRTTKIKIEPPSIEQEIAP